MKAPLKFAACALLVLALGACQTQSTHVVKLAADGVEASANIYIPVNMPVNLTDVDGRAGPHDLQFNSLDNDPTVYNSSWDNSADIWVAPGIHVVSVVCTGSYVTDFIGNPISGVPTKPKHFELNLQAGDVVNLVLPSADLVRNGNLHPTCPVAPSGSGLYREISDAEREQVLGEILDATPELLLTQ